MVVRGLLAATLVCAVALFAQPVWACDTNACESVKGDDTRYSSCLDQEQAKCRAEIEKNKQQQSSLASSINLVAGQISLQQLAISRTLAEIAAIEKEIALLGERIQTLDFSLDQLTGMLLNRVRAQYKAGKAIPLTSLVSSDSFSQLVTQSRYINQAGQQTAYVMKQAEIQRQLFDLQKQKKELMQLQLEEKKQLLEVQRLELASQKAAQQRLLDDTKNSEAEYQKRLAALAAEQRAIQAIIAGGGTETPEGPVKAGDRIAAVIAGRSCNSSNTHLHFMVTENGAVKNPLDYLKPIDYRNCSGSSCGSSDGDAFNPLGSWEWPLAGPITFTQGYGSTWATRHTWVSSIYSFHNGIDITGSSLTIKAVVDGDLYRGRFSGAGGCALQYVKLKHADSNLTSWYLHINY